MKKETFVMDEEVMVTSEEETKGRDNRSNEPDTYSEGEGDDDSGRPNRGAGSAGPKNPVGGGNRGQYSLKNEKNE